MISKLGKFVSSIDSLVSTRQQKTPAGINNFSSPSEKTPVRGGSVDPITPDAGALVIESIKCSQTTVSSYYLQYKHNEIIERKIGRYVLKKREQNWEQKNALDKTRDVLDRLAT